LTTGFGFGFGLDTTFFVVENGLVVTRFCVPDPAFDVTLNLGLLRRATRRTGRLSTKVEEGGARL
jgi:hypothetical protein